VEIATLTTLPPKAAFTSAEALVAKAARSEATADCWLAGRWRAEATTTVKVEGRARGRARAFFSDRSEACSSTKSALMAGVFKSNTVLPTVKV
jgi:hypothetical protein